MLELNVNTSAQPHGFADKTWEEKKRKTILVATPVSPGPGYQNLINGILICRLLISRFLLR